MGKPEYDVEVHVFVHADTAQDAQDQLEAALEQDTELRFAIFPGSAQEVR
jgi:hypothetical protein